MTRIVARNRKAMGPKAQTIGVRVLEQLVVADVDDEQLPARPKTRGECMDGPRPCPWVGCRHNLFLDVTESGSLKFNHPGVDPTEMVDSCALDIADKGNHALEEVGKYMNLVRERVRQIEAEGLIQLRRTNADEQEAA